MSTDEAKRGFYKNSVKQGEFDRLVELPVQIVQQLGQVLSHEPKRHYSITVSGAFTIEAKNAGEEEDQYCIDNGKGHQIRVFVDQATQRAGATIIVFHFER